MRLYKLFFFACLLTFPTALLRAQAQNLSFKTPRTHMGTDFWITVPPNFHTTQLDGDDKISLFISSERPTNGEIQIGDSAGRSTVLRFSIPNPALPFVFEIPAKDIELRVNEQVSKRSIHITALSSVSVILLNTAHQSADGMLVFPTHAAGRLYQVLNYPSDNGAGLVLPTPSQLGIVATEDTTRVRITPSAPTPLYGTNTHEITLRRGETYLLQADIITSTHADLTGTLLEATKPIVVVSSQMRANVPLSAFEQLSKRSISRDYLLEQLLPTEHWGKTIFVPLLPQPQTSSIDVTSHVVRVLAQENATRIRINGHTIATLQAGKFYETTLATRTNVGAGGLVIEGSAPIAVAVYASSNGSGSGISDPFMLCMPPQEQYLQSFRSVNVRSMQRISRTILEEAFSEHYLTLIVPVRAIASIRLDNQSLQSAIFQRFFATTTIGESIEYSFAHVRVSAGVHTITAREPIGVLAFGYGNATSYGYVAGQRLELDTEAPRIVTQATCAVLRGVVYDSARTDSKLMLVYAPDSLRQNVIVDVSEHLIQSDSVAFTARLINPYQDGRATILAYDSLGQSAERTLEIPGFTVRPDTVPQGSQILTSTSTLTTGRSMCLRLSLVNYGQFPCRIDSVSFSRNLLRGNAPFPLLLQPNERRTVSVCLRTFQRGVFTDTLVIHNECFQRSILALNIVAFPDTIPPQIQETVSDCERRTEYIVEDIGLYRSGVEAEVQDSTNCTIQIQRLPNTSLRVIVTLPNRKNDAHYRIIIRDSAGNSRTLERSIPGLRLRYFFQNNELTTLTPLTFTNAIVSALTCATLWVSNESAVAIRLDNIPLKTNIVFSIPPSQFPFVIPSHTRKPLEICFYPALTTRFSDTLYFEQYCELERIALEAQAVIGRLQAMSRCNIPITLTPSAHTTVFHNNYIVSESVFIVRLMMPSFRGSDVMRKNNSVAVIRLFDMLGELKLRQQETVSANETDCILNISTLQSGIYGYEIEYKNPDGTINTRVRGILKIIH